VEKVDKFREDQATEEHGKIHTDRKTKGLKGTCGQRQEPAQKIRSSLGHEERNIKIILYRFWKQAKRGKKWEIWSSICWEKKLDYKGEDWHGLMGTKR